MDDLIVGRPTVYLIYLTSGRALLCCETLGLGDVAAKVGLGLVKAAK